MPRQPEQQLLFDLAQISGLQRILRLGFVRGNFLCLHFDKAALRKHWVPINGHAAPLFQQKRGKKHVVFVKIAVLLLS